MSQPRDPLESWRRRLEELLAELEAKRFTGRVPLYLDFRCGHVVEGGQIQVAQPWTDREGA